MPPEKVSPRRQALEAEARRSLDMRSPMIWAAFVRIFEASLRRHFHAVRVSRGAPPPWPGRTPLVLFSNHPSWWDACLHVVVAARLFPGRVLRGPIDAAMIAKYAFMPKIGIFGIEQADPKGGALFMAICREIFRRPSDLLVITAQGRFADTRERPVRLMPGLAHIVDLAENVSFVPLAIDYTFWSERRGEALVRFGEPVTSAQLAGFDIAERSAALARALEATMDALGREAIARDASAFDVLLEGRRGVHPAFDAWRRLQAAVGGRSFDPGHAP